MPISNNTCPFKKLAFFPENFEKNNFDLTNIKQKIIQIWKIQNDKSKARGRRKYS